MKRKRAPREPRNVPYGLTLFWNDDDKEAQSRNSLKKNWSKYSKRKGLHEKERRV
jgi:hypothetical protein